jgi:heme/copper-type cytochrome/quinol oxidase subunit 3
MQRKNLLKHPYHLLNASPWPFFTAFQIFILLLGFVLYMHRYTGGFIIFLFGLFFLLFCLYRWGSDIVYETTILGQHTEEIQTGLRYGVLLFILSEVMFFFSFFWTFFYSSLSPAIQIGAIWPPLGIQTIDPWGLPLLNTLLLLTSGIFATLAHAIAKNLGKNSFLFSNQFIENNILTPYNESMQKNNIKTLYFYIGIISFILAIMFGLIFTLIQLYEYINATFTIADSVYGSIFYMATGFHGLHVIIGTTFLLVTFYRFKRGDFFGRFFLGVEASVWYWHFVDVVWIFLFICIYWWGS